MSKSFFKTRSQIDSDRIRELIAIANESGAAEVEIEAGGIRVMVRKASAPVVSAPPVSVVADPAPPQQETTSVNTTSIMSPTPGTFYSKPAPDADPFVQVGDPIGKGQIVCIIEAMKLMNEVESEVDGTLVDILVNDGDAVEYDQPLLVVDPA